MMEIEHFTYGFWTPGLAYAASFIGALLGLGAVGQALASQGRGRVGWLVMGAVSIGGTGIWAMHFIAMLGFSVRGAALRYDVPLTIASAALAIAAAGVGLALVARAPRSVPALLGGGAMTGAGVAAMHYTGMASMRVAAPLHHDPLYAAAAVAIAVVASTVALWAATRVSGRLSTVVASLVMAAAVCAMHYTGMAGMSVDGDHGGHGAHAGAHGMADTPQGATIMDFFLPLYAVLGIVTLLFAVILVSARADQADRAATAARRPAPARTEGSAFRPPARGDGAARDTRPHSGPRRPGGPA